MSPGDNPDNAKAHIRLSLLKNLFWPAAAGNVAWSFFTLFLEAVKPPEANLTDANLTETNLAYLNQAYGLAKTQLAETNLVYAHLLDVFPSILVLALVAMYLTLDWLRLRSDTDVPWLYFWADIGHVITRVLPRYHGRLS